MLSCVWETVAWCKVVIAWLRKSRQKCWSIISWPLKRKQSEELLQALWSSREETHLPRGSWLMWWAFSESWHNKVCICHSEHDFTVCLHRFNEWKWPHKPKTMEKSGCSICRRNDELMYINVQTLQFEPTCRKLIFIFAKEGFYYVDWSL